MKPLETKFTKKSYLHTQIFRDGKAAVFKRARLDGSCEHYEVIKVLQSGERQFPDPKNPGQKIVYPPSEIYPSSGVWGIYGFTCQDRAAAKARVAKMAPIWNSEPDDDSSEEQDD